MISIMAGWSIFNLFSFFNSIVVRDWNRLIMGHHKSNLRTRGWTPSLYLSVHAWLHHINSTFASLLMLTSVWWHPCLMCSPTSLCWLMEALWDETIDRPGIPELVHRSDHIWSLGISFSNLNSFHSKFLHQLCPLLSSLRLLIKLIGISCYI